MSVLQKDLQQATIPGCTDDDALKHRPAKIGGVALSVYSQHRSGHRRRYRENVADAATEDDLSHTTAAVSLKILPGVYLKFVD
jgi:hypothetical protein